LAVIVSFVKKLYISCMKNLTDNMTGKVFSVLAIAILLGTASIAEARIGGGRSMGSRGYRGLSSGSARSYRTTPNQAPNYRPNYQGSPSSPYQQSTQPNTSAYSNRGAFTRGLLGGLAGGFLGSMIGRSLGFAGFGGGGGWGGGGGIGLLEVLLFLGLGYALYRFIVSRREQANFGTNGGSGSGTYTSYADSNSTYSHSAYANENSPRVYDFSHSNEVSQADQLRRYDMHFDLAQFKEQRLDDFMMFQAAWGQRDLSQVSHLIASELRQVLDADIVQLKSQGQINRVENIAVRGTELVEAWAEQGKEYATLRFRANVTDYTVNDKSGDIITGSKVQPVKFEEDWTFVRDISGGAEHQAWRLSAIEN
jgi:predicted lipid-binding transport protein (Tim44 family)